MSAEDLIKHHDLQVHIDIEILGGEKEHEQLHKNHQRSNSDLVSCTQFIVFIDKLINNLMSDVFFTFYSAYLMKIIIIEVCSLTDC